MPISPQTARSIRRAARPAQAFASIRSWKLEDAKARLSEVVRLAATDGPQLVTVRGKEMAYLVAADEYRRLLPQPKEEQSLTVFLQGLGLDELDHLDLEREPDTGREIDL